MYSALYSCHVLTKLGIVFGRISKNTQILNFMDIRQVEAVDFTLGQTGRQADMNN
jgi:hypothetical protein